MIGNNLFLYHIFNSLPDLLFLYQKFKRSETTKKIVETGSTRNNALLWSYRSSRITKYMKPHPIAGELILPVALDKVNLMVNESPGKLLLKVTLSNKTIRRSTIDSLKNLRRNFTRVTFISENNLHWYLEWWNYLHVRLLWSTTDIYLNQITKFS